MLYSHSSVYRESDYAIQNSDIFKTASGSKNKKVYLHLDLVFDTEEAIHYSTSTTMQ